MRELLLGGIHLATPDYDIPFHLATDASEDGKGGMLCQLPSVPLDQQFPYSPRTHAAANLSVIQFLSKAWNDAARNRPPFYLEADALLWGMEKCIFYALSSKFPLYTYSDHLPLAWMSKSTKGPVSQFLIETLSELDTIHQCIPGPANSIPDAASRYPMLGPKRLAPLGLANSVQEVLRRIPTELKTAVIIHVHAGQDTADIRRLVQAWKTSPGQTVPVAPPRREAPQAADFALMVPRPEAAPTALALYLLSDVPFALLLPIDIATQAYASNLYPDIPHAVVKTAFVAAGKLTMLATQMLWVIGNIPNCAPIEVFESTLTTTAPLMEDISPDNPANEFSDPVPKSIEEWKEAQDACPDFTAMLDGIDNVAVRNGLRIYAPPGSLPKIIVPPSMQESLTRYQHLKMYHLGSAKVAATLRLAYFWPKLASTVKTILNNCPGCELEKARQNEATGMFAARPHDAPRARCAMDFQGQGLALTGETQALGVIDTTSRYVTVIPLPDREAVTLV